MNKKTYLKHFFIVFSGTALAQIVNFGAYPFLTRSYTPDDFGLFTLFLTTASIGGVITCGRYDAVLQAAKYFERFAIYKVAQIFNFTFSACVTIAFCLYGLIFTSPLSYIQILLLGLAILMAGYCNASSFFLLKHEDYKASSVSNVLRTFFTSIPQIILFFYFPNYWGLILGFCCGYSVQSIFLFYTIKTKIKLRKSTLQQVKYVATRYKKYLKVDVPNQILSSLSFNVMTYFLLYLYTTKEMGYYSLSYRMAAIPLALFSNSLSQVFFQKASKALHETGSFWKELKFNLISATSLSIVIFTFMLLTVRPVIAFYLGDEWLPTADIIVYISPMLVLRFISVTIATTPLVIGRPQILFVNNILLLSVNCLAFGLAVFNELSISKYLILTSTLSSIIYAFFIVYIVIIGKSLVAKASIPKNSA